MKGMSSELREAIKVTKKSIFCKKMQMKIVMCRLESCKLYPCFEVII